MGEWQLATEDSHARSLAHLGRKEAICESHLLVEYCEHTIAPYVDLTVGESGTQKSTADVRIMKSFAIL